MDINKQPHKQDGNKVLYFNGLKWLVRETCKSKIEAKNLLSSINGNISLGKTN